MNQWKFAVLCTHIHALLAETHVAKFEVVWRGERKSLQTICETQTQIMLKS